jgi:hypothetical protein
MKKEWLVKTFALGIVVLFFITAVSSTIGISNYLDDTTPPVTTISFYPPEPDGENGWYISDVTVTLNATDDDSGVNTTYYRVDEGIWYNYSGSFILVGDGEDILIEFYSVDNAGNQEEIKSVVIDIDQTKPTIILEYELTGGDPVHGWELTFTATACDDTSDMDKVEFYVNNKLKETVNGSGPTYIWVYNSLYALIVRGLILNPEITDEYVKFYAIIVIILGITENINRVDFCAYAYDNAGNKGYYCIEHPTILVNPSPGIYLFKNLTLPCDYKGYIGKFFIRARYYA